MKERYEERVCDLDPMILRWAHLGGFTALEIAAFNKLHVVAFNPMVDESCVRESSGIEGVGDADGVWEVCTPIYETEVHPYQSLSIEELNPLATTDAHAAVFASRLATNFVAQLGYSLQAVALTGKPGPILETLSRSGSISLDEGRNPDEVTKDLATKMALLTVAEKLGDPRAKKETLISVLDEYIHSDVEKGEFLSAVEANANDLLRELARVQKETTGQTKIWEALDA